MERVCKRRKVEPLIPRLVIDRIMRHAHFVDVLAMMRSCKRFHRVGKNNNLWFYLVKRDFGELKWLSTDKNNWLDVYRQEVYCQRMLSDHPGKTYSDIFEKELYMERLHRVMWVDIVKCGLRHDSVIYGSLFMYVARFQDIELMKLLLERDDILPFWTKGRALLTAITYGCNDMFELLLSDSRANLKKNSGDAALHCAVRYNRYDMVKRLLDDFNVVPNGEMLVTAVSNRSFDIVQLLMMNPQIDVNGRFARIRAENE